MLENARRIKGAKMIDFFQGISRPRESMITRTELNIMANVSKPQISILHLLIFDSPFAASCIEPTEGRVQITRARNPRARIA